MRAIWSFLAKKRNRDILAWVGSGIVVVVVGLWTATTFFFGKPSSPPSNIDCTIEANQGTAACGNQTFQGPVTFGGDHGAKN